MHRTRYAHIDGHTEIIYTDDSQYLSLKYSILFI